MSRGLHAGSNKIIKQLKYYTLYFTYIVYIYINIYIFILVLHINNDDLILIKYQPSLCFREKQCGKHANI